MHRVIHCFEAFNSNGPFAKADFWQTVSVRPFNKRVDSRI